jgi:hypothetical protein
MRTPLARSILALALASLVLSPVAGCGNKERRVKECISACEEASHDCARRKDRECAEHEHKCRADCERI